MRFVPVGVSRRQPVTGGAHWRRLVLAFFIVCTCELAAGSSDGSGLVPEKRPPLPEFKTFGLSPEVRQAMVEFGIPVDGEPGPSGGKTNQPGDWVVLLGTLTDEEKISRWVIQLRSVPIPDTEPAGPGPVERYSSTGNKWTMSRRKAAIEVTVLRPLAKRKTTNVLLANEDALNAGMWGSVSAQLKLKASAGDGSDFSVEFAGAPFSDERVRSGRTAALGLGITAKEEQSLEMTTPALEEFLSLILSTPELAAMLGRVVDVPLLSIVGGVKDPVLARLSFETTMPASQLGLKGADTAYVLPLQLSLGKRPILLCQLALVPPRPPLHVGAGLVGLAAGHPDGKGPRLTIEFIGSSSASE